MDDEIDGLDTEDGKSDKDLVDTKTDSPTLTDESDLLTKDESKKVQDKIDLGILIP